MLIVHALLTFDLPFVHSLKGRRKILASLKDRLKHRNIAVADVSGEYPKEATIELLFFAASQEEANNKIESLENFIQKIFPDLSFTLQYELL